MKRNQGAGYFQYLAIGIIIGVIIVVCSSFIIKMKLAATPNKTPEFSAIPSPTVSTEPSPEPSRVDKVKDPVCDKMIDPGESISYKFGGKTYYFCSEQCQRTFQDDPLPYVDFTMKVQIQIEPAGTASPGQSQAAPETPITPAEPEIKIIAEPKTVEKTAPAKVTPQAKPTIEEIPLVTEPVTKPTAKPTAKATPTKKSGSVQELQIEEIPLE